MKLARALASLGALAGFAGLGLQLVIMFEHVEANGGSAPGVVWRFVGYFTILTNLLISCVLARAALRPDVRSERIATLEAMGASGIVFVGIVYHLLLASRWNPQGWQLVSDILLHSVTPIVFALFWLARPHGLLKWRDAFFCALWPLGYAIYALLRGALDGWYAYYFMDPTKMSVAALAASIAGLSLAFLLGALALVAVDKALRARARN